MNRPTLLVIINLLLSCISTASAVSTRVNIVYDDFPQDTSWQITNSRGEKVGDSHWGSTDLDLAPGTYIFTIEDTWGDGICCDNGEGRYDVFATINGREQHLVGGDGRFGSSESKTFVIPSSGGDDSTPSGSDDSTPSNLVQQWLTAHNRRRRKLHQNNGKSFVPLKWSNELAQGAQAHSERQVERQWQFDCFHADHDRSVKVGENINLSLSPDTPEQVLKQWYDDEENKSFNENGHYTQVGWRSTKYVGCGTAHKKLFSGKTCYITTCRYLSPGNCNANWGNWHSQMLADSTGCEPRCPPKGCF